MSSFRRLGATNSRAFHKRKTFCNETTIRDPIGIFAATVFSFSCHRFATNKNTNAPDNWQPASAALPNAHAHNDYLHESPLYDALGHGFASAEVDIYLAGNELYVGHEPKELRKDRTLECLYLEPLRQIIAQNNGKVFSTLSPFTLLIDIKTDADNTYKALRRVLKKEMPIEERENLKQIVASTHQRGQRIRFLEYAGRAF